MNDDDGRGMDPDPDPGSVVLVLFPDCEIVIVVGGIAVVFVVVEYGERRGDDVGLIVVATPASAAFAVGSGSACAADWTDLDACCRAVISAFTISPTFIFITELFGGGVVPGTLLIISFHTGNKAGLASCDQLETS